MTYKRIVARWGLGGDYESPRPARDHYADRVLIADIAGDLRRLERDQRDNEHLVRYAVEAECTTNQAKAVLDAFFEGKF